MEISKPQILKIMGLPVLAAAFTFVLLMMSAFFVSGLPRPQQGEAIAASWPLCILSSFAVTVFIPWLASLALLRQARLRIYFLACLALAAVIWYYMGFDALFSKAYGRGL